MVDKIKTNAKFKDNGDKTGVVTFEIDADAVKRGLDAAFNKVKDNVQVPGFRKGSITKEMFIQRFGEESLYEDALNDVLPEYFDAAIEEVNVITFGQPQVLPEKLEKKGPWVVKANVNIAPSVTLGDYAGVEVKVDKAEVSDDEVAHELEHMRQMEAELVPAEEGYAAKNGDTTVIDFDGSVDGVHFDGGKGENYSLALGSGSFIPGFEDQLVGKKAGEDVKVNVKFPENYQASDLAGKDALFEVKIHEIKKMNLPELDDEFAKDVDEEVATLEELKTKIKDRIKTEKQNKIDEEKETKAVQAAVDNAKLDVETIPHDMIEEDVHRQMNNFFSNLQAQGVNPEMYFQLTGTNQEAMHKQFEGESANRVKTNLVLEAIAQNEKMIPSDKDIDAEYERLSKEYNIELDRIKTMLTPSLVSHDLRLQKAVNFVVDNAKVK